MTLKKILIPISVLIIVFFVGLVTGWNIKNKPSGTIETKPPITSPTVWKDKDTAKNTSPLQITGSTKNNTLGVDCWDNEKSIHADFPLVYNPKIRRHIIQASITYQYHNTFYVSYGLAYLYNFGLIQLGAGAVGSNQSFGIQGIAQVNF
jgi:hypothetical protein